MQRPGPESPASRLLALETSSEACSIALQWDGVVYSRHEQAQLQHAELLLPWVRELLEEAGATLAELDAITFGRGPGSFTSLRIGIGAVQGLVWGAGLPVIPLSSLAAAAQQVLATAEAAGELDVACALAEAAARYGYVRPSLDDSDAIEVRDGRHPMVERSLAAGAFVPNDVRLSSDDAQIIVLTGPNMAGKSTYLRMTAVIALMAQIGSFVPAASASIGVAWQPLHWP